MQLFFGVGGSIKIVKSYAFSQILFILNAKNANATFLSGRRKYFYFLSKLIKVNLPFFGTEEVIKKANCLEILLEVKILLQSMFS